MKVSIAIFSISVVIFSIASYQSNNQVEAAPKWWTGLKNAWKRSMGFFTDRWEGNRELIEELMEKEDWVDAVEMVSIKGNVANLFPLLRVGKVSNLVKHMMKNRTAMPLIQNLMQNADKMKEMVANLNPIDNFEIGMVVEWFDIYKEIMDIESNNPMELIRSFPKTPTGLGVKLMKYGFMEKFPEQMAIIDDKVSDRITPKVMDFLTKVGNKDPKYKRITQVINLFINFQDERDAGPLANPVTTLVNALEKFM